MSQRFLLGIDQGTSGSRALIIDQEGVVRGYAYQPLERLYPQPDWVEQDPQAVVAGVKTAVYQALSQADCPPSAIAACGLTCQRNTLFAWHPHTRQPIGPAITWQDLRTLPLIEQLADWPDRDQIHRRLGYTLGPYNAALHLSWRLKNEPALQIAALSGQLRLGLSAAWLVAALGQPHGHQMDRSLVQATGLYDFRAEAYWAAWLERLAIPDVGLPEPTPTITDYGTIRLEGPTGAADVPVLAMIGDQQAALFGHHCHQPGDAECTHGTASYVKVFMGPEAPQETHSNTYYAWQLAEGEPSYCLEAPTTVSGAVVRWLRDNLKLFSKYQDIDRLAAMTQDSGGLYFVPAFTGLNSPYNDINSRGTILGLSLGHHRGHIIRAFLEGLAYQIRAIVESIADTTSVQINQLLVGGGLSNSDLACQIQADLLAMPVRRPHFKETTAWAAALLAGLGAGFWPDVDSLPTLPAGETVFEPELNTAARQMGYQGWQKAVKLARQWGTPETRGRQV